jgi:hypothetical protein
VAVVHLENLDVPIGIERVGNLLDHAQQQIEADAHIRRQHDGGLLGGAVESRHLWRLEAGGADDVDLLFLGSLLDMHDRGGRACEFEHRIGLGEEIGGIVSDTDAERGCSMPATTRQRSLAATVRTSICPMRPAQPMMPTLSAVALAAEFLPSLPARRVTTPATPAPDIHF